MWNNYVNVKIFINAIHRNVCSSFSLWKIPSIQYRQPLWFWNAFYKEKKELTIYHRFYSADFSSVTMLLYCYVSGKNKINWIFIWVKFFIFKKKLLLLNSKYWFIYWKNTVPFSMWYLTRIEKLRWYWINFQNTFCIFLIYRHLSSI